MARQSDSSAAGSLSGHRWRVAHRLTWPISTSTSWAEQTGDATIRSSTARPSPKGPTHCFGCLLTEADRSSLRRCDGNSETAYWLTPQWIDEGNAVLATLVQSSPDSTRFQAVAVSVATGQYHVLIDDARHARDIGGMLVYWRNGALFAVRFDSRRLAGHRAARACVGERGGADPESLLDPRRRHTRLLA